MSAWICAKPPWSLRLVVYTPASAPAPEGLPLRARLFAWDPVARRPALHPFYEEWVSQESLEACLSASRQSGWSVEPCLIQARMDAAYDKNKRMLAARDRRAHKDHAA